MNREEDRLCSTIQEVSDIVDAMFPKLIAKGKPFLGSMNIADIVIGSERTTMRWKLAERLAYFKMSDREVVTDDINVILSVKHRAN